MIVVVKFVLIFMSADGRESSLQGNHQRGITRARFR